MGARQTPSRLQISWHEQGGPPVHAPARRGFGTKFIESSISFELSGTAKMSFDRLGVRCMIELPIENELSETTAND
jgi:two-component sensor histidine kinase